MNDPLFGGVDRVLGSSDDVPLRLALVVDDDEVSRMMLKSMLNANDYQVVEAENGEQGVEQFDRYQPDIVFMDVLMPVMDGLEATQQIKARLGNSFVPVIFLTALGDDETLGRCVSAGGDDFLSKPSTPAALRSKIIAVGRIQRLYKELRVLNDERQREAEVAEQVFNRVVAADNVAVVGLQTLMHPASTFSGDVLLTAYRPDGDLYVFLGDFTGHGLVASIGSLPLADTFRAMAGKGFSGSEILQQINNKLCHSLPTGMFLCGCLVWICSEENRISVWNGGMPDVWLLDTKRKQVKHHFPSIHPPMGIQAFQAEELVLDRFDVEAGDRVLISSDGVVEARNFRAEQFGDQRFERAIQQGLQNDDLFGSVKTSLELFCGVTEPADDISMVEIPCSIARSSLPPEGKSTSVGQTRLSQSTAWKWQLELTGSALNEADPVPMAIGQLQDMVGPSLPRQAIFTVLSELYVNALDHGVLGLESTLKSSAEGFSHYYDERESRLANLSDGFVCIKLSYSVGAEKCYLEMRIEDSGPGFNYVNWVDDPGDETSHSGRGILLVNTLCDSLRYYSVGNHVEAILSWARGTNDGETATGN
ncbi:fused response regulator/phosphatase [Motiliproteus sp. MSK22-1]|uniref:ATP-binding SpoIIE family protein phosphatase n=1 Tax=Motiliproteus sp. MSK22-1 TaxID=1897630 RepID=UPI0009770D40|nr:fused response regulator/phosphatase [Motiliproteus sp. MSK22-1]OMH33572.1 hypothetical protein BGP75_11115 [Motiliproteus sp. MSK22-1]